MSQRPAQGDRSAPVVRDHDDPAGDLELRGQAGQVIDPLGQRARRG